MKENLIICTFSSNNLWSYISNDSVNEILESRHYHIWTKDDCEQCRTMQECRNKNNAVLMILLSRMRYPQEENPLKNLIFVLKSQLLHIAMFPAFIQRFNFRVNFCFVNSQMPICLSQTHSSPEKYSSFPYSTRNTGPFFFFFFYQIAIFEMRTDSNEKKSYPIKFSDTHTPD